MKMRVSFGPVLPPHMLGYGKNDDAAWSFDALDDGANEAGADALLDHADVDSNAAEVDDADLGSDMRSGSNSTHEDDAWNDHEQSFSIGDEYRDDHAAYTSSRGDDGMLHVEDAGKDDYEDLPAAEIRIDDDEPTQEI
jgi:hypothetical protein